MQQRQVWIVGLSSFVMALLIGSLIIWKSGVMLRATGFELIGEFNTVNGLLKGGDVRYRGYRVGRVAEIVPGPETIRVYFFVEPGTRIPEGSELKVIFDGLIGEKYIAIVPKQNTTKMVAPHTVMHGYSTSGLADFVDVGTQNLEETKAILVSLRQILTSPEVGGAMRNTFLQLEKITANLAEITESSKSGDLKEIVENIRAISETLRKVSDTVFVDGQMGNQVNDLAKTLTETMKDLKEISGQIKDRKLVEKVDDTLSNLATISNKISGKELEFKPNADVYYSGLEKKGYYDANMDIHYTPNRFWRVGFGNRTGSNQLLQVQQGFALNDVLNARLGLIYNQPGLGIDYQIAPSFGLSLDVFNLQDLELNAVGRYRVVDKLDFTLHWFKDPKTNTHRNYAIGISYRP